MCWALDKAMSGDAISRRVYSGLIWVDKSPRFLESTPRDIIAPGEIDENFRCQILIEGRGRNVRSHSWIDHGINSHFPDKYIPENPSNLLDFFSHKITM